MTATPPEDGHTPALGTPPPWIPHTATPPAPVTVIVDPHDEAHYMRLAFTAHQPGRGHITVHPTPAPAVPGGAYLAHDVIRALGKHLPILTEDHHAPPWITYAERSWRIAAAWILALGVTRITVCRAHRLTRRQWEHLLTLNAGTGIRLTLLCNGPLPPHATATLAAADHRLLDDPAAAAAHWRPARKDLPGHRWWQHHAPFPPTAGEVWFPMPPQPTRPVTYRPPAPPPHVDGPITPKPPPHAHQDHCHPHTATVAARIHTRIAHPVHAACVAVRVLTGYTTDQIGHLLYRPGQGLPPLPAWTDPLLEAARRLAEISGHPDTPNPLASPRWQHPEIEQALTVCRLLPSPPARTTSGPARSAPKNDIASTLRGRTA